MSNTSNNGHGQVNGNGKSNGSGPLFPKQSSQPLSPGAKVLVTGGAGFIGSHLANLLVEQGYRVRIFDKLSDQVHGADSKFPEHLHADIECVVGNVLDRDALRSALRGVDAVYHLAAAVGVGQSMYQIAEYTAVNNLGTATLLECLAEQPVQRLVVASSMSVYCEGLYRLGDQLIAPLGRSRAQLLQGEWELREQGQVLTPVATSEDKALIPTSVYALSKYDQEKLCLIFGEAYGIPTVALRFFNAYGPYQALSNPYTGVLAIFAARCLNGNAPLIFEDGLQQRDFVNVKDVAQACLLALTTDAIGEVFNIGSGQPYTIADIATTMIDAIGATLEPEITGKFRVGDIRHCFADISKAQRLLGYRPRVALQDGMTELAQWLAEDGTRNTAQDNFMHASKELASRGLTL
jgi:dTDP-L-rhamnose 4-epimerase